MSFSQEAGLLTATMNSSTMPSSVPNANQSLSSPGLLSLPLRGLQRAESFAFSFIPGRISRLVGLQDISVNAGRTTGGGLQTEAVAAATQAAGEAARGVAEGAAAQSSSGIQFTDLLQSAVKFSGFFSYLTSRWSLACFAVALVLNRVAIYASTRRHLRMDWTRRLALRIIPILLFTSQIYSLLRAIRCQTSDSYPELRYGAPGKRLRIDHAGGGGFLYSLSSTLIPWETDQQSCSAMDMTRVASDIPLGSFRFLWPVFLRICLSHFVETLSSSLQGRPVVSEGGMSIFEHSLSFAEAESTIAQSLGLGPFGSAKPNLSGDSSPDAPRSSLQLLTKSQILDRMNVTPELLLIAVISCCHCLSSNLLDVIGKQSRYRLFNTAFWGLCFMSVMTWGLVSGSPLEVSDDGVYVKFPTVCVVGFIPHLMILVGIVVCCVIYSLALCINAFSLPSDIPQQLSLRERFLLAHQNMQGSNQVDNLRLSRHEDFYSALLRIGYVALTAASEAVFLNEGRGVVVHNMTWLEEDRLSEIQRSRPQYPSLLSLRDQSHQLPFESAEPVTFEIHETSSEWESGYGRDKKIEKPQGKTKASKYQSDSGGVGAFRGIVRCYQGIAFFRAIFYTLFKWMAIVSDRALTRIGISRRPKWFKTFIQKQSGQNKSDKKADSLDFWMLTEEGELELPANHEFDVEKEMRKRERLNTGDWNTSDEQRLDEKLYNWWKVGGSWGDQDQTPDYKLSENDWDDTSSVISTTTATDSEWEDESDGRRTPTQTDPYPDRYSREGTPAPESLMDVSSIARLLDPRDEATRQEARILAAHLNAGREGRILTRRQYQEQAERQRAQILLSSAQARLARTTPRDGTKKPTFQEESEILENLILEKRSAPSATSNTEQTWETGASGLGAGGPPCVVCQTSSRSIIVWPCRCLCICEDCRVSLAMNNFGSCVTCRQEVGGFVRLWVP
ncbi:hypothetical protein BDV18DRAFT_144560 [Aspergillus unguis]